MAARGSPISREDYNNLRKIVYNVLGPGGTNPTTNISDPTFGYGQTLSSSEIGPGDQTITEAQWDQIRVDINKAYTHQVGSATVVPDVAGTGSAGVTNATKVTFSQVYQTYLTAANEILANRLLFAGSQRPQTPIVVTNGTKITTTPWSNSITQNITVTFNSASEARYFFNSGATINFKSSRTGGTTSPQNAAAQNNSWTSFLNTIGTVSFGKLEFYALTPGGLGELADPILPVRAAASPYTANYFRVYANSNVTNNTGLATVIQFRLEWVDSTVIPGIATDFIDGTFTSIISETKSVGALSVQSPISYSISELNTSGAAANLSPTFTLTSSVDTVSEGSSVTLTLTSRNYPANKVYQLEITGVSAADLTGSTPGIKTITTQGNDTLASVSYTINVTADSLTDPNESIVARVTVSPDGYQEGEVLTKTISIVDSSTSPTPVVSISSTNASVVYNEAVSTSSPSTVTVTNTGSKVLSISNITVNKGSSLTDYSADFTGMSGAVSFSPTQIAIGQSKTFTLQFSGSTVGVQTAVVTVTSDGNDTAGGGSAPGSTKQRNVSVEVIVADVNGITITPNLSYTTSYATNGITAGETAPQTIRISNSGNSTVTLGNVTVSSESPLTHTITNNPNGLTVAPGTNREFQIKFTGIATGNPVASPVISIDCGVSGTKTVTATVTGTQQTAIIYISPEGVITATQQPINVQTTTTFNITNQGQTALTISNITITGQNSYSTYSVSPTTLSIPAGITQAVTITSKRSRIGPNPATITITSNASGNTTKTVDFTMTSQPLTPTYHVTMSESGTSTDQNAIARGKKGTNINSYMSGAEPNADSFALHRQASGIISGWTGTPNTIEAAFGSGTVGKRQVDGSGQMPIWTNAAPDETKYWDVGISRVYIWCPVGKLDAGTQQWAVLANKGSNDQGYFQMEVLPSLTQTLTPEITLSNIDHGPTPAFSWSLSGGYPNTVVSIDAAGSSNWNQGSPEALAGTTDSSGNWKATDSQWLWEAGEYTRVLTQTVNGQKYTSNSQTIKVYSPAYYSYDYAFGDGMAADSCWVDPTGGPDTRADIVYRFYRSFTATPGVTYGVKLIADDLIWATANGVYLGGAGLSDTASVYYFTQPAGKTRAIISWTFKNAQNGGDWAHNPGAFAIQVFQGGTKIWGTRSSTGRGY